VDLTVEVAEEFAEIAEKGEKVQRSFVSLKMTMLGPSDRSTLLGGRTAVGLLYR
jgi:hypothetical protein